MEIDKLKRNPELIKKLLIEKEDKLICKEDLRVIFPARFINRSLAIPGVNTSVIGFFAILDNNNNYGVFSIPAMIVLEPNMINDIKIDEVEYKELEFNKGELFTANTNLVKRESFMYDLFDEFFIKGKIPWYMTYEDISNIFIKAKKYAGSKIGDNIIAMEIISSIIARNPENVREFYRSAIKDIKWMKSNKPVFVGLKNPYLTFNNTTAKLVGAYFNDGITSALIDKEKETTQIEELLRN